MSSFAAERSEIETRFAAQWVNGASPRTAIGWDQQPFTPPVGASSVRLTIKTGEGNTMTTGAPGSNLVRRAGVLMIQVFVPAGLGSATLRALLDHLEPIFTNQRTTSLLFRAMDVASIVQGPTFLEATVNFAYQRDKAI